MDGEFGYVFTIQQDGTRGRPDKTGNGVERGGLAGAIRSKEADDNPGVDLKTDPVHHGPAAVPFNDIPCFEKCH